MPFGVRNGPPYFQRAINTMLAEHGISADIAAFIDDLGNGGADHDHAATALGALLTTLDTSHFMVEADKIWAGYDSLSFLGY